VSLRWFESLVSRVGSRCWALSPGRVFPTPVSIVRFTQCFLCCFLGCWEACAGGFVWKVCSAAMAGGMEGCMAVFAGVARGVRTACPY